MGFVRHILPYLFVLFFLFKANKRPFFLLGIPFLMFMSNSIFFENAKPFQMPGSIFNQLIFIWLVIVWLISRSFSKGTYENSISKRFNTIDICVVALIIICLIGLIRTSINYYPLTTDIVKEFWFEVSLFLGYFIIKDCFTSQRPEIVINFLYCLVAINSIACVLFILHQGLHLNVYIGEEYMSESFQGEQITRSFWFMPQFFFFSIIFLLVFTKKYSFVSLGLLLVNLLAIIITYTISFVIIAILIFVFYFLLNGLKNGKLNLVFKNLILYALLAIAAIYIMSRFMPANMNYLLSRISEHTESKYTEKEPNDMNVRFTNTSSVISKIDRNHKLLGIGPLTEFQDANVLEMQANTADIVWSGIILRWGFIGLALFIIIYLFSSFHSFNLYLNSDGVISDFALFLLLYIISQTIEGFVSWTFLSSHGWAIGLWYFSLLSSLSTYKKTSASKNIEYNYSTLGIKQLFFR